MQAQQASTLKTMSVGAATDLDGGRVGRRHNSAPHKALQALRLAQLRGQRRGAAARNGRQHLRAIAMPACCCILVQPVMIHIEESFSEGLTSTIHGQYTGLNYSASARQHRCTLPAIHKGCSIIVQPAVWKKSQPKQ